MNIFDDCVINELVLNEKIYYHAFEYKNLLSIYNEGVKSLYLQRKKSNNGWNGKFYISVCRKYSEEKSAYRMMIDSGLNMLMLDSKLHALNTNNQISKLIDSSIFIDSIIPIRTSEYDDEYQILGKVKPKYIQGIRLNENNSLAEIKSLFLYMIENNIVLPCYDYTFEKEGIIREVEKIKLLKK